MNILDLPRDIIEELTKHFNIEMTLTMVRTCRQMRDIFIMILMIDDCYTVHLTEEFINEHSSSIIPSRVAAHCHFVITCNNPSDCVKKLLVITGGKSNSITVILVGDFVAEGMAHVCRVSNIKWTVDVTKTNYTQYLESICAPRGLLRIDIDVVGIRPGEEHLFDIDTIKQTINDKEIYISIKFPFPFASFARITNNIDRVSIEMGDKDVEGYTLKVLSFVNNDVLTIKGLRLVNNIITVDFTNVDCVMFDNVKLNEHHSAYSCHYIDYPVRIVFENLYGIREIVRHNGRGTIYDGY
jgi:hypothetical protein